MHRASGLPLTLALAALVCGCGRHPSTDSPSPLQLRAMKFERAMPGCGKEGKEPCATFHVEWQEVVKAPTAEARTRINAAIQAHLQPKEAPHGFEAESQAFFDAFSKFHKEFPESEISFFVRRSAEIEFSNGALLCVLVNREESSGGAMPFREWTNLNLRPDTGEEVRLEGLLNDGAMPELTAAVEGQFRADHSIAAGKPLSEAGFLFPQDTFALSRNWGAEPGGLRFTYNQYEIAPGAEGPTVVFVDWAKIGKLLRARSGIGPGAARK